MHNVHRALDGTRFVLDGELDLDLPFTSTARLAIHGRPREFTAGGLGLAAEYAASLGIENFDEELSYQDGVLRTAHQMRYDRQTDLVEHVTVAAWQGRRYSLFTHIYGGSTADLLGILREFGIEEYDDGLVLRPGTEAHFAKPSTIAKQVPRLGLLHIGVPRRSHVPTERLTRERLGNGKPYFVLDSRGIQVTVLPLADTVVERVPDLLAELQLRTAA